MTDAARTAHKERKTNETSVSCRLDIDGGGKVSVTTGVGFFDHMLDLLGKHALFDMELTASGDTHVDAHHTVEDVGIVFGEVLREALGEMKGLTRFGFASVPMDEALCRVSVDISGRGYSRLSGELRREKVGEFDVELVEEFLRALATNAKLTLHVEVVHGDNAHHTIEAVFKALAVALRRACEIDPRRDDVPSTKGVL